MTRRFDNKTPVHVFVDVEARGISPVRGTMTEFGCVTLHKKTFHGRLFESSPDPEIPAIPVVGKRVASDLDVSLLLMAWLNEQHNPDVERLTFVSDNPGYDYMWIAGMFDRALFDVNPFGHSSRRLGDYWAGLNHDWKMTGSWKKFRVTAHTHDPVDDAMGNVEAFHRMMEIEKEKKNAV